MTSNIILSKGGTQVTISTTKSEFILNKAVTTLKIPNTGTTYDPTKSKTLDLNLVERRFSVDGQITDSLGSGDTSSTATGKYTDLQTIIFNKGVITMSYRGTDWTIQIDKISITEVPTGEETAPSAYDVKFTCIVTNDLTS